MEIVLFEPQIPQNTGNIIRTCFLTNSSLTLVKPLGFSLSEKNLKRAGLDYFANFPIQTISSLEDYLISCERNFYFFSSKVKKNYCEVSYTPSDILIFGSEVSGLPSFYFEKYPDRFLTIPMKEDARCLNLSNSVAIALYEGLRQNRFPF